MNYSVSLKRWLGYNKASSSISFENGGYLAIVSLDPVTTLGCGSVERIYLDISDNYVFMQQKLTALLQARMMTRSSPS